MSKKYFKKGETLEKERTGLDNINKYGSLMKVIKYNSATNILVQFEKGNPVHTTWNAFYKGRVTNPYDLTVYGVGYIGEGNNEISKGGKHTIQYHTWSTMLQRCYDSKRKEKFPTYKNVTVCSEWHCFNTFANWFNENFYKIDGERVVLDKDILFKGNKIYSPDTCVFVPEKINILFTKSNASRGDLPIGVHCHKKDNKYRAHCSNGNKTIYLGTYDTIEKTFFAYKIYKEKLIKEIAENYKSKIPIKLYSTLIKYEVDITD